MAETPALDRIADYLRLAACECPDRAALICKGRAFDYREYEAEVGRLALGLLSTGFEPGDRIALLMDNCPEHPTSFLAAERIGLVSVLVNNRHTPEEIDYVLGDSNPRSIIVGSRFLSQETGSRLRSLLESRFEPEMVFVVGPEPGASGFRPLSALKEPSSEASEADLEGLEEKLGRRNPVAVIYTSGTTGRPKGAVLTERNIVFNLTSWRERLPEERDAEVVGVFFPLFHSAGMIGGICGGVINRFTVVLADFDLEESLRLIGKHGVTVMGAVAAMTALQLLHPNFEDYDLSSLEYIIMGAGPCPPEILREVKRRMGADVIIGYGLTEGTMGNLITTLMDDTEEHKLKTIGVPLSGVEVKLVDQERKEVPEDTVGEIAVKGPTVFAGYLNNPEATKEVVDSEGWLYTGDLATRGGDGYYRIVGRKSEMYIRGGENVYPREIEDALKDHPGVALAAVLGIPDEVMGEEGRAYVIKAPGSDVTEEDIKSYLAERLSDYKVPREVLFVESLPLTPVGKVLKKELAERIRMEFGEE